MDLGNGGDPSGNARALSAHMSHKSVMSSMSYCTKSDASTIDEADDLSERPLNTNNAIWLQQIATTVLPSHSHIAAGGAIIEEVMLDLSDEEAMPDPSDNEADPSDNEAVGKPALAIALVLSPHPCLSLWPESDPVRWLRLSQEESLVELLKKEIASWFEAGHGLTYITIDDLFEDKTIAGYERTVVAAELRKLAAASPPLLVVDTSYPERFNKPEPSP